MSLSHHHVEALSSLLRQETAVVIDCSKDYLIEARLGHIAHSEGFPSISELIDAVLRERTTPRAHRVLLALTTHETSFFRDGAPFEALRTSILPSLIERRKNVRSLSIWSAGCSSGQEPYSIAILLKEFFPQLLTWKVQIIGTDINPDLIKQASKGIYSQLEVKRGLSSQLLEKYFSQREDSFVIKPEIQALVHFSERNLIKAWAPFQADIIFLRNVLIYFDVPSRKKVLKAIYKTLAPDGYLMMGTAESTRYLHPGFESARIPSTNAYIKAC